MPEYQSVEFKREHTAKIMDTMLAFLNTDGGTLHLDMGDDGSECGTECDIALEAKRMATSFRYVISPSPSGLFRVEPELREGRHGIVITVERGTAIPYCYIVHGLVPKGVYVSDGGNTVMATHERIRQMIKDSGTGQFLGDISINQHLTFECANGYFVKNDVKLGMEYKQSLGLMNSDGRFTNLALILSDQCPYTAKVVIFEGLNKDKVKERKEFTGSLLKQMEDVPAYLRVFNRVRSTYQGVCRTDQPDYPDVAIREAFLNALIHRDYGLEGSVLVGMLADRLEFISLGGTMPGVTHDLMLAGVSVARNEKLTRLLCKLNVIEACGTGIPRIYGAYEESPVQPEIPVVDGGFVIRLPNMNRHPRPEQGFGKTETNEQRLISVFADTSFSKEDAAGVLGITVHGAYKLLQRSTNQGLLVARKQGREWIYSKPQSKVVTIETSDRLFRKVVAFSGTFDGGSLRLKDLVYFAGGAPSDQISASIGYLVLGRGGKGAAAYRNALPMIKEGGILEMTEDELQDICSGQAPAPQNQFPHNPDGIEPEESDQYILEAEELACGVYETLRSVFAQHYGILQPDGTRTKHHAG